MRAKGYQSGLPKNEVLFARAGAKEQGSTTLLQNRLRSEKLFHNTSTNYSMVDRFLGDTEKEADTTWIRVKAQIGFAATPGRLQMQKQT